MLQCWVSEGEVYIHVGSSVELSRLRLRVVRIIIIYIVEYHIEWIFRYTVHVETFRTFT